MLNNAENLLTIYNNANKLKIQVGNANTDYPGALERSLSVCSSSEVRQSWRATFAFREKVVYL